MRHLARWTTNIALILVSTWIALWMAEYGLRLVFHGRLGYAPDNEREWHVPHATRGWAHRPGAVFQMQRLAYSEIAHINSRGVRGPEFKDRPEPGVFRILLVSDSGAFGSGVADDQHLGAQLSAMLGSRFEVINLSVAAYSNVQEYLWLIEEGLKYQPSLVLLGFSPGNDIQTNYFPLQRWFQREARRPYAELDGNGKVVIVNQPLEDSLEHRQRRPRLRRQVYDALVGPMVQKVVRQANRGLGGGRRVDPNVWIGWILMEDFAMDYAIKGRTRPEYEKRWSEAWAVTQGLIGAMRERSHEAGARFAMWAYVNKLQAEPETLQRVQQALPKVRFDIAKPERELKALGARLDIPVIELLPAIQRAEGAGKAKLYFGLDDEHMTPAGYRVTAEAIAAQLVSLGLLPRDVQGHR